MKIIRRRCHRFNLISSPPPSPSHPHSRASYRYISISSTLPSFPIPPQTPPSPDPFRFLRVGASHLHPFFPLPAIQTSGAGAENMHKEPQAPKDPPQGLSVQGWVCSATRCLGEIMQRWPETRGQGLVARGIGCLKLFWVSSQQSVTGDGNKG